MEAPVGSERSEAGARARASLTVLRFIGGAMVLLATVLTFTVASASASALNLTGVWEAVYHCETGWCAGAEFPATDVLTQAEGSDVVTGSNAVESITGTLTGNTLEYQSTTGSYTAGGVLTISADGLSWSGSVSDNNGTSGTYTAKRKATKATILGSILDTHGKPAYGVTVTLSGTNDEGTAVSETTKTNSAGKYGFEVAPGTYSTTASGDPPQQNGGKLSVAATPGLSPAETGDLKGSGTVGLGTLAEPEPPGCTGTGREATCTLKHLEVGERGIASFTYTYCGSTDRMPNGKAPTGCPIVFIPGFLGSRITCNTKELWTNTPSPNFGELQLLPDGNTNAGAPGSCNSTAAPVEGQAGVVSSFAGINVYGEALQFLNRIAPGRVWAFTYDWRKSPLVAAEGLSKLVDQILSETHAARLVIMAHSMGGLVTQAYVSNPGNAEKVSRVVTLGTPYWGAPKSHVALLTGHTGGVPFELVGIDMFGAGPELQTAARNLLGLFWLYPSANYGPWLKVVGNSWRGRQMGGSEIDPWVTSLGGQRSLVDTAMAGHSTLDGFKTNGIDYQIVVGTGEPTITSLEVEDNDFEATQFVQAGFGSGDGTVPALSATQGAFATGTPLGDNVPIHYVCGIEHMGLPSNFGVQSNIEGFLLEGKPITGADNNCPYTGAETQIYHVFVPNHGNGLASASAASGTTVSTASGTLTLEQAAKAGLIQLIEIGGKTTVITDGNHPVTLKLSGKGLAVKVRPLTRKSPAGYYGPLSGVLTISDAGVVERGGKVLKARGPKKAPHTSARVARRGRRFLVRLSVKAPAGASATYFQIGKAPSKIYRRPLVLTKSQLKRLHFASVDHFGDWERAEKAHVPR